MCSLCYTWNFTNSCRVSSRPVSLKSCFFMLWRSGTERIVLSWCSEIKCWGLVASQTNKTSYWLQSFFKITHHAFCPSDTCLWSPLKIELKITFHMRTRAIVHELLSRSRGDLPLENLRSYVGSTYLINLSSLFLVLHAAEAVCMCTCSIRVTGKLLLKLVKILWPYTLHLVLCCPFADSWMH